MPAFTTKLSLYKPGGGSTGTITPDETADIDKINDDLDIIDAAVGAEICTSGTRPSTPYDGKIIFETDTKRFRTWRQSNTTWEAGATARGQLTRYLVTDLTALTAIADATIGDTLFMTTPGTGIDALNWEAFAGSGVSIDWRVRDTVVAATKADLDTFIAAVAAVSGTDAQFKVGSLAFVLDTAFTYRFTSTAGAILLLNHGWVPITPTITSTGGTVTVADGGEVQGSGAITQLNVTIPAVASYKSIRGRLYYIGGGSGSHTVKLMTAGTPNTATNSYRRQGTIAAATSIATALAAASSSSWDLGYSTANRLIRDRKFTIEDMGATRTTTWDESGSDTDNSANDTLVQALFRHTDPVLIDGIRWDFTSMGTFVNLSLILEGYI